MASVSRRLCRTFRLNARLSQAPKPFSGTNFFSSSSHASSDTDEACLHSDTEADVDPVPDTSSTPSSAQWRDTFNRPLQNGLDSGVYKAILVGQAGQKPVQKTLKTGRRVTLFSLGTGGIRNNRRPLDDEDPKDYANRCDVQWHRVSVYPERLGDVVVKNLDTGSIVYVEGNLEQKVFCDPVTGLVRRLREVAIRRNGRIVFLGKGGDSHPASPSEVRGAGYHRSLA